VTDRYLLDANVLLRRLDAAHPQHEAAREALHKTATAGAELVIVPQVLYEFWAVVTRPASDNGLGLSPKIAAREIENFKAAFTLLHDTPDVLKQWERLAAFYEVQGKQSHDVRLVAAMKAHGLTHLLTFNSKHFRRFATNENIVIVKPNDEKPGR
jgi:predicted nucleic acid-binding protein